MEDQIKEFLTWLDANPEKLSVASKVDGRWTDDDVTRYVELIVAETMLGIRAKFMRVFDVGRTSFTLSDDEYVGNCLARLQAGRGG